MCGMDSSVLFFMLGDGVASHPWGVEILVVASYHRNQTKSRHEGPFGLYVDFNPELEVRNSPKNNSYNVQIFQFNFFLIATVNLAGMRSVESSNVSVGTIRIF